MKRVEERKAELRQKAEEKKEMARIRRLRAKLNSRLAKWDDGGFIDKEREVLTSYYYIFFLYFPKPFLRNPETFYIELGKHFADKVAL